MSGNRRLVLSRTAITLASFVVSLPLVAWAMLWSPPNDPITRAAHWCFANLPEWSPKVMVWLLLVGLIVEMTFRWIKFAGLLRFPWLSFFFVPMCLIAVVLISAIGHASPSATFAGMMQIGVILFFQLVGHLSLAQRVMDGPRAD